MKIELPKNEMTMLNNANSGFKITRIIDGETIEIELSDQELYNAFAVQERKFHVADIEMAFREMEVDQYENEELYGCTMEKLMTDDHLLNMILSDYEYNRENGMYTSEAARDAILYNIHDYVKQNNTQ